MKEIEIKRLLIQEILSSDDVEVVAHEFSFDFGRCRADLVCIKEGALYGYEIKSAFDKTVRLESQLSSYFLLFDYVTVVCDEKHLRKVRECAPIRTGLYICDESGISKRRAPKRVMRKNELVLLDAMPSDYLRRYFSAPSARSKFELCQHIKANNSKDDIKKGFMDYLVHRMGPQTRMLKGDVSGVVTLDDFYSLGLAAEDIA